MSGCDFTLKKEIVEEEIVKSSSPNRARAERVFTLSRLPTHTLTLCRCGYESFSAQAYPRSPFLQGSQDFYSLAFVAYFR